MDINGFRWIWMDSGRKSGGGFKGAKAIKGQNGSPSDLFWLQTLSWGLCIEIQWLDCSDWIELIGLKLLDCNGPTRSTSGGSADVSRVGMLIHCSRLSHVHFSQRATDIIISRLFAGENNKNRWPHLSLTIGMIMMVEGNMYRILLIVSPMTICIGPCLLINYCWVIKRWLGFSLGFSFIGVMLK